MSNMLDFTAPVLPPTQLELRPVMDVPQVPRTEVFTPSLPERFLDPSECYFDTRLSTPYPPYGFVSWDGYKMQASDMYEQGDAPIPIPMWREAAR